MARLKYKDRMIISEMYLNEDSILSIAVKIGAHPATIYAELRRGHTGGIDKNGRLAYDPDLAQRNTQENLRRCGKKRQ